MEAWLLTDCVVGVVENENQKIQLNTKRIYISNGKSRFDFHVLLTCRKQGKPETIVSVYPLGHWIDLRSKIWKRTLRDMDTKKPSFRNRLRYSAKPLSLDGRVLVVNKQCF